MKFRGTTHRDGIQVAQATRMRARVIFIGGCLLLLSMSGCGHLGKPNPADRPVLPGDVLEFSTLYKQNCSGCHGANGELGGAPPLRDPLFRAIVPHDEVDRIIAKGRPGTPMPAFAIEHGGTLTPAQLQILVFEIKGLRYKTVEKFEPAGKTVAVVEDAQGTKPKWGLPEPPPINAPPYLLADANRRLSDDDMEQIRKTTFAKACSGCHEDHGQGGTMAGAINGRAFLSLVSDQVLRRLIITGRPDLKMPNFAGTQGRPAGFQPLNSQELSDLVALLGSWRRAEAPPIAAAPSKPGSTLSDQASN